MYLKKFSLVLITILGFSNISSVEGLRRRRTTKSPLIETSTTNVLLIEHKNVSRHYHKPQTTTQYPPSYLIEQSLQHQSQYPPQQPPQYPPQEPPEYPPQEPPKYPPQQPPQYPPQQPPQYSPEPPAPQPPQQSLQYIPSPTTTPITHLPNKPITVVDQFDHRYPNGGYEYRYELSNENVRYECGYFVHYQHKNILVVKGYYSYRLPDLRYLTVFYTADQYGYRLDSSTFALNRPVLPRSLNLELNSSEDVNRSAGAENSTSIIENKL